MVKKTSQSATVGEGSEHKQRYRVVIVEFLSPLCCIWLAQLPGPDISTKTAFVREFRVLLCLNHLFTGLKARDYKGQSSFLIKTSSQC